MMKILGLVLALALVVGGACVADSVTLSFQQGYNLVAVPIVPYDAAPASVFANVFALYGTPRGVLSTLSFGSGLAYDPTNPPAFGGIMLGQGYWLNPKSVPAPQVMNGFPDGLADAGVQTDMWISMPGNAGGTGGAWTMFGQPFDHNTYPADIQFTDGLQVLDWPGAVAAGWVNKQAYGCDIALKGGNFVVSYDSNIRQDDRFRARHGYQMLTKKANIAMIVKALPVAP